MKRILFLFLLSFSVYAAEEKEPPASPKIKYKAGETLSFDKQVIQGSLRRPEASVVTGDREEMNDGLLRLRENFLDHALRDAGIEETDL